MADGVEFDFSELKALAADLGDVPASTLPFLRSALQVTATNVKADWRRQANRTGLHGYAADITYDTTENASGVSAEIGPTPGDAGSFGLVEDATGDVRSAPQHAGRDAMRKNEGDFVKGIMIALDDGLKARGL